VSKSRRASRWILRRKKENEKKMRNAAKRGGEKQKPAIKDSK
jgi:hypothetical protein